MNVVLVTGADGYLGRRIVRRLLERTEARVVAWMHAADAAALEAKRAALVPALQEFEARLDFAGGELGGADPFAAIDASVVDTIVHTAAVTRFNVDAETAERVNVGGASAAMALAARCSRLSGLALLSSVYAAGRHVGEISEARLTDAGFANHYEGSKWRAEERLFDAHADLPWIVLRIATAIADDTSGRVTQQNAVHNTLQLLYHGLISTVPGRPETPLYLVTGDMVAEAVVELLLRPERRLVYHVAHRREQSLTLGGFLDAAFESFAASEAFRRRRILKPLYIDEAAFDVLHRALDTFSGPVVTQAVGSMAPFAPQLYLPKSVRNDNLIAGLGYDPAPDPLALARATCAHLVTTSWGRGSHAA
jgi:thioester reductase-like protein